MVEEEEATSSEEAEAGVTAQLSECLGFNPDLAPNKHGEVLTADTQNSADFLALMHQRFLNGDDHEYVDYQAIDKNVTLDDDWAAQAEGDAQEKYFDAD